MSIWRWPWTARLSLAMSMLLVSSVALVGVHVAREATQDARTAAVKAERAEREAEAADRQREDDEALLRAGLEAANARLDALGGEPVAVPNVTVQSPRLPTVVQGPPGPPGRDGAPGRDGEKGEKGDPGVSAGAEIGGSSASCAIFPASSTTSTTISSTTTVL